MDVNGIDSPDSWLGMEYQLPENGQSKTIQSIRSREQFMKCDAMVCLKLFYQKYKEEKVRVDWEAWTMHAWFNFDTKAEAYQLLQL